jgi:hypothetical protein
MQTIAELERRISAALQRIGDGIESLAAPSKDAEATDPAAPAAVADSAAIARLQSELEAERRQTDVLRAQLSAARMSQPTPAAPVISVAEAAARIEKMTNQLDVQGLELHRMRKTVVQLRENLRGMRRAQTANLADPDQINRAMAAELEAMRVTRLSEVAELDEIIAELDPLIGGVREDA